jgi:hypothetical protein
MLVAIAKALPAIGRRLRHEPVLLIGAAMAALQAVQSAPSGLEAEDLLFLAVDAALVWAARELVYPAIRVKEDPRLRVEEPLPAPVPGRDP